MNKITLTADAEIDPNGYRVFINKTLFSCGVSDINDAMRAERLADAEKKLEDACAEIILLMEQLEEQTVLARFWRRAADVAVAGWNALEDKHEELLRAVGEARNALEVIDDREEWAPPLENRDDISSVDFGDGRKLRVVETERLIDEDVPPKEKK